MYEVFEHTADIGLRVRAASLESLLADAARGLYALLVANPEEIRPVQEKIVRVPLGRSSQHDYLLFDWLNELLFLFDTEGWLLSGFEIALAAEEMTAVCHGERVDRQRHQLDHEVKAITYHGLMCAENSDGDWVAEVIVDI